MPAAGNILTISDKGTANGVAPLNAGGFMPEQYIPGSADELIAVTDAELAAILV